jgi:hypothetical protein
MCAVHFCRYGTLLLPMVERYNSENRQLKFLEIGLGCNMWYGAGASVGLWKALFQGKVVELWEADINATCVEQARSKGQLGGVSVVTGDQSDHSTLKKWVEQSGGEFDVIIDDGGHRNSMILKSLEVLWPQLTSGGWYFIEDLHISYRPAWIDAGYPPTTLVIQSWVEALSLQPYPVSPHHKHLAKRYPLPDKCDMILCQREACALHKEDSSGL